MYSQAYYQQLFSQTNRPKDSIFSFQNCQWKLRMFIFIKCHTPKPWLVIGSAIFQSPWIAGIDLDVAFSHSPEKCRKAYRSWSSEFHSLEPNPESAPYWYESWRCTLAQLQHDRTALDQTLESSTCNKRTFAEHLADVFTHQVALGYQLLKNMLFSQDLNRILKQLLLLETGTPAWLNLQRVYLFGTRSPFFIKTIEFVLPAIQVHHSFPDLLVIGGIQRQGQLCLLLL